VNKVALVLQSRQLGLIDYLLVGAGSMFAGWSAGMAINDPRVGLFTASLVAVGLTFSYCIRLLGGSAKWLQSDAIFYTVFAIGAIFFQNQLRDITPGEGFPRLLFAAGYLSWMLIFGSFFAWRDSTLLFQAVPSLALFGLVGCYDTYRNVIFPFYGFLLCLATFFARTHSRQMLREAVASGFFTRGSPPGTRQPDPEAHGLYERLASGPWRWMAGPEWALASAFVVVVFSLLGAPVIQGSVKGVAGYVRVPMPNIATNTNLPPLVAAAVSDNVGIGRGPARVTDVPMLEARMAQPWYLRGATYDVYTGRGWRSELRGRQVTPARLEASLLASINEIRDPVSHEFTITLLARLGVLPMPAELIRAPAGAIPRPDGTFEMGGISTGTPLRGEFRTARFPVGERAVRTLPEPFGMMLNTNGVSSRVAQLAHQVTQGVESDWEKAYAIKREIESRIVYNIETPATPNDRDPVEHALFDSKMGYCDVFASSMVVMARSVGIPARYTTGFLPKVETLTGDTFIVRESDAHAWAELFFEDIGWVIFDATEGADAVDGAGVGSTSDATPWYKRAWFLRTIDVLAVILLVGAVGFGYRQRRHRILNPDYGRDLDKAYLLFTREIGKKVGKRRMVASTSDEYLKSVGPNLGGLESKANALNERFMRAYYASGSVSAPEVAALQASVRDFREEMKRSRKG
jgi:transglutaminase-like putative cysteine protease